MNPGDLLDPEVAAVVALLPFASVTVEILPSLRVGMRGEVPLSDAVERTDHRVPGDPELLRAIASTWAFADRSAGRHSRTRMKRAIGEFTPTSHNG